MFVLTGFRMCLSSCSYAANVCQCPHGMPATGADCTANNANMCESCNVGFRLNPQKTACEGLYGSKHIL